MKLSVLTSAFRAKLATVARVVPNNSALPVLQNVLLRAENDVLMITGTDLETAVITAVGCRGEQDGAVTLPAKLLLDFVATLSDDGLTMTLNDKTQAVTLTCGRSTATIKGIEADEYPSIPHGTSDTVVAVDAAAFKRAIDTTIFAAADNNDRPILFGGNLIADASGVTLQATDGFRLARHTFATDGGPEQPINAVIPRTALEEVARLLTDDDVQLEIQQNRARVTVDDTVIVTRLLDGRFPDVQRVIPQAWALAFTTDRDALLRDLKQSKVFASASANIIKLAFENSLIIRANATDVGDSKTVTEGVCAILLDDDREYITAANVTFLRESIAAVPTPRVTIKLPKKQHGPIGVFDANDVLCSIVMPISVKD